jgi:hypothetical protein
MGAPDFGIFHTDIRIVIHFLPINGGAFAIAIRRIVRSAIHRYFFGTNDNGQDDHQI